MEKFTNLPFKKKTLFTSVFFVWGSKLTRVQLYHQLLRLLS